MTKEELQELVGEFSWSFNKLYHIKTEVGDFEWSDPEYGGDNSIKSTVSHDKWLLKHKLRYSRKMGIHRIRCYCGTGFKYIQQRIRSIG